jgi:hypothetical protein
MENQKDFAGSSGFIWWMGFIEDRKDPLKLGRLKVRCVGWHADNKLQVPTDKLPWAQVAFPANNTNTYAPKEGDMVFGFFMDGESAQDPVVIGVFNGIPLKKANAQSAYNDPRKGGDLSSAPRPPKSKEYKTDGTGIAITEKESADPYPLNLDEPTTSRIARNDTDSIDKTFIKERKDNVVKGVETYNSTWDEPETKYGAVYPYNNVMETESGHLIEYDDTPGKERVHIAHRNGSFTEWYPDGDRVEKITKDKYSIVMKDDNVYIMGKCNITVQGDAQIYVKENAFVKVDKNVEMTVGENVTAKIGGDVTAEIGGNVKGTIGGNMDASIGGSITASVGGSVTADISGGLTATASSFTLNGPTQINGTLNVSGGISGGSGSAIIGTISATGDITAGSISLQGHRHTDTPGTGAGTTSPPF